MDTVTQNGKMGLRMGMGLTALGNAIRGIMNITIPHSRQRMYT